LRNHAPDIASIDLFVVPTIGFDLLYAFVIVRLDRRDLVWINVTTNPTAEWVARQITRHFWDEAPHYLIRDRDRTYGSVVTRRLCAMGIRDKPRMRTTAFGEAPAADRWPRSRFDDGRAGVLTRPMQHPELHTSASVDGVPAIINGVITAAGWVSYVRPLIYFGSFGALGGFAFWVARYGPAPSEKPRRPPIVHELLEPSSGIQ
jgi:hypothetical protein